MTNTAETHALVQREKGKKQMIQRRLIPAYIFLIIISFLSVFPLLWMISAATNTSLDVARGKIMFGTYAMQNFKNLIASLEGDVLSLEFEASPGIPVNYVLITIHCVPYSGSVSA